MTIISRTDRPTGLHPLLASARLRLAVIGLLHVAALVVLWRTEYEPFHIALAALALGLFNCAWLVLLRRPGLSAALSLAMVCSLILLSQFKTGITWVAISFLDFLIVDPDTIGFLLSVFPQLRLRLLLAAIVIIPLLVMIWRLDPFSVRRRTSALAGAACLLAVSALSCWRTTVWSCLAVRHRVTSTGVAPVHGPRETLPASVNPWMKSTCWHDPSAGSESLLRRDGAATSASWDRRTCIVGKRSKLVSVRRQLHTVTAPLFLRSLSRACTPGSAPISVAANCVARRNSSPFPGDRLKARPDR